jgi:SAM-dependent methyltransferase
MAEIRVHDRCWLCHEPLSSVYWEDPAASREFNYRYLRCDGCGLVLASPYLIDPGLGLDESLHANYVNDVDAYTGVVQVEAFLYVLGRVEEEWFNAGRPGRGRLLELGSAAGYFLSVARARGWSVQGIEPAVAISEWSRRYLQVPVQTGFFEQVPLPDGSQEVVVAIEVLEHVLDPDELVRTIHRWLSPEGMVFLTTPNVDSPLYFPPGPTTGILVPLDHLNLFSVDTLRRLVERAGFVDVRVETAGPDGLQLQVFGHKAPKRAPDTTTVPQLFGALQTAQAEIRSLTDNLVAAQAEIRSLADNLVAAQAEVRALADNLIRRDGELAGRDRELDRRNEELARLGGELALATSSRVWKAADLIRRVRSDAGIGRAGLRRRLRSLLADASSSGAGDTRD